MSETDEARQEARLISIRILTILYKKLPIFTRLNTTLKFETESQRPDLYKIGPYSLAISLLNFSCVTK
jgi:hypothetical protein